MANTGSLGKNQNHDDAISSSSKKRSKTFDKGDDNAPWSDLKDDVLLLVMMQLGFFEFFAFSGVCKSWRSLALSNRNWFMASKPPMEVWSTHDGYCCLEDFKGRRFKSAFPHSAGRNCYGITCGYLILMGKETHDFWLVNPITRHQLHFPELRMLVGARVDSIRAILVFSGSISGWVFVVLHTTKSCLSKPKLSFYIHGKKGWNHVSSTLPILDLHFFKGKIYTVHRDCSVRELRLYPNRKRKWTLIETTNVPKPYLSFPEFVSSGEDLYVTSRYTGTQTVLELDIGEMKWVMPEKTIEEYAFFFSKYYKSSAVMKVESWAGARTRFESDGHFLNDDKSRKCMFYYKWMWYFPHDCLNANILDE